MGVMGRLDSKSRCRHTAFLHLERHSDPELDMSWVVFGWDVSAGRFVANATWPFDEEGQFPWSSKSAMLLPYFEALERLVLSRKILRAFSA